MNQRTPYQLPDETIARLKRELAAATAEIAQLKVDNQHLSRLIELNWQKMLSIVDDINAANSLEDAQQIIRQLTSR